MKIGIIGIACLICLCTCKKDEQPSKLPNVVTGDVIVVLDHQVSIIKNEIIDGMKFITEYGVCFNKSSNPSIYDNKI